MSIEADAEGRDPSRVQIEAAGQQLSASLQAEMPERIQGREKAANAAQRLRIQSRVQP